jgi:preprotein translocase subunit SecE
MKIATVDEQETLSGRARESVTGWWGRSRRFLSEVRNEMARVTWPSRKEVYATTVVVILFSVAMGVFLWMCDLLLSKGLGWVRHALGGS